MTHTIDEWAGCYPSQWKGLIVPGAIAHPAKFSSRLIRRIYDHMIDEGMLQPGDSVLDPFGGVALGALEAMRHGLHWQGVELEAKFADLGNQNIALWNSKFSSMPRWGTARLHNGDSRKLLTVIREAGGLVSSPPYVSGGHHNDQTGAYNTNGRGQGQTKDTAGYGETPGQLGKMKPEGFDTAISSPPFADGLSRDNVTPGRTELAREKGISNSEKVSPIDMEKIGKRNQEYGHTEGQLGAMNTGDFAASISSPPFRQSEGGTPEPKPGGPIDEALYARHAAGNSAASAYGSTEGQLADMAEGDFEGTVSSPPYNKPFSQEHNGTRGGARGTTPSEEGAFVKYGNTDGQIEGLSDDNFWMAARVIVEQVYQALQAGGHAAWVVKDFVKNKQLVPFCDQWRQLCEAVGFVTLHEHHAMLVHAKQVKLDGTIHHHESKSFFRRVAEKKGSPRVDYEVVYCMIKPQGE